MNEKEQYKIIDLYYFFGLQRLFIVIVAVRPCSTNARVRISALSLLRGNVPEWLTGGPATTFLPNALDYFFRHYTLIERERIITTKNKQTVNER